MALGLGFAPQAHAAAQVQVLGTPPSFEWEDGLRAYTVAPDTGISFEVKGPGAMLVELRAQNRGKRVIVDLVRDKELRSRNATKLRPVGGKRGYRFVTLLAMDVPEGKHSFSLTAQGAELVAVLRPTPKLLKGFAIRPFVKLDAPEPEAAALESAAAAAADTPEAAGSPPPLAQSEGSVSSEEEQGMDFGDSGSDLPFEAQSSDDAAGVRLALSEDALSIGGRLFQRVEYRATRRPTLDDDRMVSPNSTEIYVDARPSDRIRGYIEGRLLYDPSRNGAVPSSTGLSAAREPLQVLLDEMWLKADVGRTLFFTVGKQHLRWGVGRFWNPTDFLSTERRDPFLVLDERVGKDLIKLHLPIESLGWNLYAIGDVSGVTDARQLQTALRAEIVFGPAELSTTAVMQRDRHTRFGVDLSASAWILDLKGELALQQGYHFYQGDFDISAPVFPERVERPKRWTMQAVAGVEAAIKYTDSDQANLGVEYFYNEIGYDNADYYAFLLLKKELSPLYVGKHYAGVYLVLPDPGPLDDTTFILTGMSNLSDGSRLARFELRRTVLSFMDVHAFVAGHFGENGELRYHLELPAQPNAEAMGLPAVLAEGIDAPAPAFEAGVGLLISM